MISVKNAEISTRRNVIVIIVVLGCPFSRLPVFLASHLKAYFTGNRRNRIYPTPAKRTQRAVRPEDALTRATLSANRTQPTTSFPTPAESVTTPTVVSSKRVSVRIRQSTGKAVIPIATATNKMKYPLLTDSCTNSLYSGTASAAPRPKGRISPTALMVMAARALRLINRVSISRPTRKRKNTRPIFAVRVSRGMDC